jgi:NodT family efflux transporter outer membrane factor (OMF) lipoprotein
VEAQRRAGKVSGLEVERQRSQVATTEAAIPPLLQQLQMTRDALSVLLGKNPGEVEIVQESLRPLSLPAVTPGLPSELLERRPDIRRAEADLISANADIGAARAALFPSVSLSAEGGYARANLSTLFKRGSGFYSFGLDLLATIFDWGRLSGQVDVTKGRKEELVAAYYQSIVSAFRDVEDALAGIEQFSEQEKVQQEAALHAREAYRIAEIRYRLGAADFTTVLDAERTLLNAEAAVDPARLARFTSFVGLFRALGGGW